LEACGGLKVTRRVSFGPLAADTAQGVTKLQAFSQILPSDLKIPDEHDTPIHSPAGTDLRIDWADACSLDSTENDIFSS